MLQGALQEDVGTSSMLICAPLRPAVTSLTTARLQTRMGGREGGEDCRVCHGGNFLLNTFHK